MSETSASLRRDAAASLVKGVPVLDFRVQTFLTVCRTLNYTQAARELNITQPAVSQHIAALERHYGTALFVMEGKRPRLTEAGRMLERAFSSMVHDERLLEQQVAALDEGASVSFAVGMTLTAGEYIVAPALARWLRGHSEVRVTARSGDTRTLLELLDEGALDCAFVEGVFDRSLYRCDVLCTQRLVCVCAPGHELAGRCCSWERVLAEPLVVREPGSGTRAVLANALAARNLSIGEFARVSEAWSIGVIKRFVEEGLGVSFLYEAAVRREVEAGRLALVELEGPPVEHPISFVRLAGSVYEPMAERFFADVAQLM